MQVLIMAAGDTVAVTCYTGFYFALADPYIISKIQSELDQAWPDVTKPMTYQDLEKLPYFVCRFLSTFILKIT
jgi:hypothetical protein